ASSAECRALAGEAGKRRLVAAVPALESLCRRFRGFGRDDPITEQIAALDGLAMIGGAEAARTVAAIVEDDIVQGPGLGRAVAAAARLGVRLSAGTAARLLRHAGPEVRADACRCAGAGAEVTAILIDLLGDLHPPVAAAAACALGRLGRIEARPALIRLLAETPSPEVIAALAAVADQDCMVLLARLGRARPELTDAVLAALDDMDDRRATQLAGTVRRAHAGQGPG
ncbi:MAG TPA: HEAT repeat domain-containing protein, partial [Acetobacteraceae bacterium]|nr:HEAT repeat domain-containing protein [Acetobacteraceae bacterium]